MSQDFPALQINKSYNVRWVFVFSENQQKKNVKFVITSTNICFISCLFILRFLNLSTFSLSISNYEKGMFY